MPTINGRKILSNQADEDHFSSIIAQPCRPSTRLQTIFTQTSIGTASIYRFVRPISYQGFPDEALPELLQDANPRGSMRTVDGELKR